METFRTLFEVSVGSKVFWKDLFNGKHWETITSFGPGGMIYTIDEFKKERKYDRFGVELATSGNGDRTARLAGKE